MLILFAMLTLAGVVLVAGATAAVFGRFRRDRTHLDVYDPFE